MANALSELSAKYEDLEEVDEWLSDVRNIENQLNKQTRRLSPKKADVLKKRQRVNDEDYLKSFVRMQEYKWQSKFNANQASRLRKRLQGHTLASIF